MMKIVEDLNSIEDSLQYDVMRLALTKYGENASLLPDDVQKTLRKEALAIQQLRFKILRSPEAATLQVSESEIMDSIAALIKESETDFNELLSKHDFTHEKLIRVLNLELLATKVLDSVSQNIPELNLEHAHDYYHKNIDKFSRNKLWNLNQILITVNEDYDGSNREEVIDKIDKVHRIATLDNFSHLALQHSECPSAANEGSLGWCESGKLYPEIEQVLEALEPNRISQPIETELGFHLVMYQETKSAKISSFDEVKPQLMQWHKERAQRYCQKQWLAGLE
ncbi:peptidylprolyl isomerase [Photobacterium sp. ZSDE20]|uniref:peptidylprolyl isomerase n=1 Tax=Photobacterium pectinilyticum TaxID=2906793 RepID=A0ABT1N1G5_9GAMM|nr:peptidylprolyl isomerase [Photobacterium sp. ZSDE20]MCQ1058578.1 peptidylprolyl isomerase [Photobacterium sp. ZSDE20]MDD1826301.1 peptidylprolyl isomerase [Photobacterium sp. ZSDE20]